MSEAAQRLRQISVHRLRNFMVLLSALEPLNQTHADPEMQIWQETSRDELLERAILAPLELPTTLENDDGKSVRICCTLLGVLLKNAYNTNLTKLWNAPYLIELQEPDD